MDPSSATHLVTIFSDQVQNIPKSSSLFRNQQMIRNSILFALSLLCGALLVSTCHAKDTKPTNVIYILADDLGYTDVACFGSKYYETPNLDQMAREGIRLTSAYTCGPNCQPTRAATMSGQYGPRTGIYTVGDIERFDWRSRPLRPVDNVIEMPLEKILMPRSIKNGGYTTAIFGKWHLGDKGQFHPTSRGFDEGFVTMGKHFDFVCRPPQEVPTGTYLADYLTDRAVEFINKHKSEPFFLYLPHFGVHSPTEAKPDLVERFKSKPAAGGHKNAVYAAMIFSVDESVGRVRKAVKDLGLEENTLIIFTSDNGGVGGYNREGIQGGDNTDNAPLKGGKGMLYEGGIRVPYIASWKNAISPGTTSDEPINSVDLYPTLLEATGAAAPEDTTLDGTSYLSVLKGQASKGDRRPLYWHFPGYLGASQNTWRTTPAGAIRQGDWKLIEFFEDGRRELYNLRNDVGEKQDLAKSDPDRVASLHDLLKSWRTEIKAPMPTKNEHRQPPRTGRRGGGAE